jgi:Coenzyme PQQ synthesis protein D (PqqD)
VPRLDDRLCPNTEEVAAKVMDGEAIMINLSNGMYYSMDGVGALIWGLVDQGHSLQEITRVIAQRYEVAPALAEADVERLAAELLDEKLVRVSDPALAPGEQLDVAPVGEKLAYEPPKLNAYRDMGDLLALDPPMPGLEDIPWHGAEGKAAP